MPTGRRCWSGRTRTARAAPRARPGTAARRAVAGGAPAAEAAANARAGHTQHQAMSVLRGRQREEDRSGAGAWRCRGRQGHACDAYGV